MLVNSYAGRAVNGRVALKADPTARWGLLKGQLWSGFHRFSSPLI